MEKYHMRRNDKEIKDEQSIVDILQTQDIVTISMCKENNPYLVTMDYYYAPEEDSLYFHCSSKGKKIDYLKANPAIWGEVLIDNGYIDGECSHAYKSVHFSGKTTFIESNETKRMILRKMIEKFEKEPQDLIDRFISYEKKLNVEIGKIQIEKKWGKLSQK